MKGSTWISRAWPPVVPIVVVTIGLEACVRMRWIHPFLVPLPSRVLRTLFSRADFDLWYALGETALAAMLGFAGSVIGGMLIGMALASSGWLRRAFYPYTVFFQTVPIIAIAPLLVIWVGFGLPTVVMSAFIVSVFPVIANTFAGMRATEPALVDLFRLYGATPIAAILKLRLPYALPNIFTGLRVAAGLSVIGAIVGEFITGGGIGDMIKTSIPMQRTDKTFAALLLASVLGVTLLRLIDLASRLTLRNWHASEAKE